MTGGPRTDAHGLPDSQDVVPGRDLAAHPGSASQQEKGRIDAGVTGDKVAHTDVAAASPPTDDEAGGGGGGGLTPQPAAPAGGAGRDPDRSNERAPPAPWLWVVAAVVAALALGWFLLSVLT